MQTQTTSSLRAPRRRPARAADLTSDLTSIVDGLIADRRAVATVFDLLQDELAHPIPDRNVCIDLLMKIDALLAAPPRPSDVLVLAADDEAHASLCAQLDQLVEADRQWRAKAEVLTELVENRVFDASPAPHLQPSI